MSLHATIKEEIKKAMLAKDPVRLNVVRGIASAFTNELVAKGKKPQEELADNDALLVVKKLVKHRKDSIEQFGKGGRSDLVAIEQSELAILETYLPAQISKDEIKKVVLAKKEQLGITDKTKAGVLIGAVLKELRGQAD